MKHDAVQSLWRFAAKLEEQGPTQTADQLKALLAGLEECWTELEHKSQQSLAPMVHVAQMAEVGAQTASLLDTFTQAMAEMQDFVTQARSLFDAQENADLVAKSTAIARQLESVRQAQFLVQRLLGEGQAREMEASLEVVVLEMLSVYQLQLDQGRIEIDVSLPRELPRLRIERNHLFQVLAHLVGNSIDALTGARKRIIRIEGAELPGGTVSVQVADTGCGIPLPFRPRLFEPNFSTKGKHGTGLGLHIATLLAESSGGNLRLGDPAVLGEEPPFATLFEIVLPATESNRRPSLTGGAANGVEQLEPLDDLEDFDDEEMTYSEASALDAELQDFAAQLNLGAGLGGSALNPSEPVNEKVMAFCPELGLTRIIERYLSGRLIELMEVSDPGALSAGLSQGMVDLVVLDATSVGQQTLDFARFLRAEHPLVELLLIVSSKQSKTALEAFALGGFDHIIKPPPSKVFIAQKIRAALNHRGSKLRSLQQRRQLLDDCQQAAADLPEADRLEAEASLQRVMSEFASLGQVRPDSQILLLAPASMARMADRIQGVSSLCVSRLDEAVAQLMKRPEMGVAVVVDGTGDAKGSEMLTSLYGSKKDLAVLMFTREQDIESHYEAMGDRLGDIVLRPGESREFFAPRLHRMLIRQAQAAGHLKLIAQLDEFKYQWAGWI